MNATKAEREKADQDVIDLAKLLREDNKLVKLIIAAEIPRNEWIDNIIGQLTSYPLKLLIEKPAEVKDRNIEFIKAIEKFSDAVTKFEKRAGCQLLKINEAAVPFDHVLKSDSDYGLRCFIAGLPDKTIQDYLSEIAERVDEGEYGDCRWQDSLVTTPNGGLPTNASSMASTLAISVLKIAQIPAGAKFNELAAYCASAIYRFKFHDQDDVSAATIATMLRNAKEPK